jgi:adenylate cyclase
MAVEIERKFLVASDAWREGPPGVRMAQGYLSRETGRTVRVRIAGEKGFLTIKGPVSGISRAEFEYEIPVEEARELLAMCPAPWIDKIRHERWHDGHCWEVDEFLGDNAGLVVAEIELYDAAAEFALPAWIGREVSDDVRYFNSRLAVTPWPGWKDE